MNPVMIAKVLESLKIVYSVVKELLVIWALLWVFITLPVFNSNQTFTYHYYKQLVQPSKLDSSDDEPPATYQYPK